MKLIILSLLVFSTLSFAQSKSKVRTLCLNEYSRIIHEEIGLQVKAQVEDLRNKEINALRAPLLDRSFRNDLLCRSVYGKGQLKRAKKEIRNNLNYVVTYQSEAFKIVNTARNSEIKRIKRRLKFNDKKLKRAINQY